jgi:hypothetical protein
MALYVERSISCDSTDIHSNISLLILKRSGHQTTPGGACPLVLFLCLWTCCSIAPSLFSCAQSWCMSHLPIQKESINYPYLARETDTILARGPIIWTGNSRYFSSDVCRHRVRAVKEVDLRSTGLRPRRFESCRCRSYCLLLRGITLLDLASPTS